ncbi:uncharacterized protein LOC107632959 [Arachis ipaensis]|uniref:uncharacterized protein LOC107632959 n=1 Tax=Arachis ipaensis TaxID=130454 RepID=UPI0007AF02F0|nr:uncharacterized protein LOC107632959 [Arachis ipaensis]QHO01077.1 uncharacterized protein DS421_13g411870 [Arachis hypogaea]
MDNSKWDDATDQLQHLPESVLNLLTCIDPSTYYGLEPYFNKLESSVNNEDQHDQLDPTRPLISLPTFPASPFLDVLQTKNISSAVAKKTGDNCNISTEFVSTENAGFSNGQSPPPPNPNNGLSPPRSPIMQGFYSIVRVIFEYQSKYYSMLLPSAFSLLAFLSRPDFIRVRELHKPPIIVKLRWRSLMSSEAFLTRGRRKFSVDHGLKCGSVVCFCIPINDETTIFVSILHI